MNNQSCVSFLLIYLFMLHVPCFLWSWHCSLLGGIHVSYLGLSRQIMAVQWLNLSIFWLIHINQLPEKIVFWGSVDKWIEHWTQDQKWSGVQFLVVVMCEISSKFHILSSLNYNELQWPIQYFIHQFFTDILYVKTFPCLMWYLHLNTCNRV